MSHTNRILVRHVDEAILDCIDNEDPNYLYATDLATVLPDLAAELRSASRRGQASRSTGSLPHSFDLPEGQSSFARVESSSGGKLRNAAVTVSRPYAIIRVCHYRCLAKGGGKG